MTASEQTWLERDPDDCGIWWSDEENQFVCEATILSAMPFDLLQDHPTDESSYWNLTYINLHHALPKFRQKAYCKDILWKLGQTPKITPQKMLTIASELHPGFVDYEGGNVFPEQYFFSPSCIGFYVGIDSYLRNPKTKHIIESSIAVDKDGRFWTHYNPFELILLNPDTAKVHRPKLGRRMHHQMMILGNHQNGFGSCFMPHEKILSHVTSLLHNDVIDKHIPIVDPLFSS